MGLDRDCFRPGKYDLYGDSLYFDALSKKDPHFCDDDYIRSLGDSRMCSTDGMVESNNGFCTGWVPGYLDCGGVSVSKFLKPR